MINALIGTWQPPIWLRWYSNKTTEAMHPTIFPQKSTFIEHQFFHLPRRWRQVGRPRRVSPTVSFKIQNSKFNIHHSSFINSSTYHADGDKWADHGGSALPF
jgi:hypothetical protein